ncbi:Bromodomain adjacent to zinc finger domain protein 1A [Glycine soja]
MSIPFEFKMEEKSTSCNVCDTWCSFSLYVHIEQVAATAVWELMTLLIKPIRESEPVSALLRQRLVLCSVEYRMQLSASDDNFPVVAGSTFLVPQRTKGVIISKSSTVQIQAPVQLLEIYSCLILSFSLITLYVLLRHFVGINPCVESSKLDWSLNWSRYRFKVTVCDICGDQGFEEYLAICNKCPDGAEHIYCNDEKLEKVPDGDWWTCEDCRKSPGSPLLNSEFNGQLTNREVEKNVAIHDTRKRKNLGLLSKSVSFDNASSVKLNGKCSEVIAANDSAYTPVSNPLKRQKNRDMVGVREIGESDAMDSRSSGDRILLGGGDNFNSGCSDSRQSLDGKKVTPESVPEDGPCMSVENVGDNPSKDVKSKMPMEENNNADNGKLHGKRPMDEKNDADRLESSLSPASSEDLRDWEGLETLSTLLWLRKISGPFVYTGSQ